MPTSPMNTVILHLRKSMCLQDDAGLTDHQLLERFVEHRDEAAFAALVRRHGSMVMGVCLRVVRNRQDAEDAFQATFLVLVRKAASISSPGLVANWLYGVAYNTALKAKASIVKRQTKERQVTEMPDPAMAGQRLWNDDLQALLDQELNRLPEKYRVPIILCDLEGRTRKEAAQQLRCPEGSLSSRLSRARVMLAKRLARHGLAISGGSLAAVLSQNVASACVPTSVASATIKSAMLYATGHVATGVISPKVAALTQGVLKTMLLSKLKIGTIWLLLSMIAFGAGLFFYQAATAHQGTAEQAEDSAKKSPQKGAKQDDTRLDNELKKDLDALQGKWSGVSLIEDGEEAPAEIVKAVVIVFKGDKMTFQPGWSIDATEKGKVKFCLDPDPDEMRFTLRKGSNPKEIHLTASGPDKKINVVNIYKLNGDTLTLCGGEKPTPVEFTGRKGSKQGLLVLKRLPQKDDKRPQEKPIVDPAAKANEQLQGTWRLVACTQDGYDVPADVANRVKIAFQGDKMRFTPPLEFHELQVEGQKKQIEARTGEGSFEVSYRLNPAMKPKDIDLTLPYSGDKGPVVKGIYMLENNRLRLCVCYGDRPQEFGSKEGSKQVLYVMERTKPAADPPGKHVSQADEKAIQGSWKVVSAERYGKTWQNVNGTFALQTEKTLVMHPNSPKVFPNQVVFSGDECSLEFSQGTDRTLVVKDAFALDSARKPKWITLTEKEGQITYGIYTLDGDELRLCWQYGQRRDQRPTGFKTKKEIDRDDDTQVWVLKRRPQEAGKKSAAHEEASNPVAIKQSWDGIIPNRNVLKESPPEGFVVEAAAWEKLWKGWRAKEKLPAIDFDKQMAIILTVPGPNKITAPELRIDDTGNVKVPLPVSTLLHDDGRIGYTIIVIDRTGVKSVNGKSITKSETN
jgi:RNA polymerase sigma factor (sigma-70 family)